MGWISAVVRPSDWNLVTAFEMQRSKEERAAPKEWAPIDDLVRPCEAAGCFSDFEVVPSHAYRWDTVLDPKPQRALEATT